MQGGVLRDNLAKELQRAHHALQLCRVYIAIPVNPR